jgi:hypothetical protein
MSAAQVYETKDIVVDVACGVSSSGGQSISTSPGSDISAISRVQPALAD